MLREPFNDGWRFGPRRSLIEQLFGSVELDEVTLPHDAMLGQGRSAETGGGSHIGYFRPGAWQYEKTFDAPASWADQRVALEFEGVYRDAMVYVNDAFAGQWANGYSMFHVPIDPYLRYGEPNTVRVEAHAYRDSRWYSGGGIYRPVHLLIGGLLHIAPTGLRVATPDVDDEFAVATVATELVNEGTATRVVDVGVEIHDPAGRSVASGHARTTLVPGDRLTVRQRTYLPRPVRWSVDEPNLYRATVNVSDDSGIIDEDTTTFGVRTLSADPYRGLRINGEPVNLRGACIHHDNGVLGAAGFARAEERRVQRMKEAGFNAIRSAHNPISRATLDACDRLGMLVMDETFDIWAVGKTDDDYSRSFSQWWERDVDAMVAKDINHPSVIFYSIGNEIIEVGNPHGARMGRQIAERIRSQDPTRLTTNAINPMFTLADQAREHGSLTGGLNENLGDFSQLATLPLVSERIAESATAVDVLGLNYADARYPLERAANRVVVGSETFPPQIAHLWAQVREHSHVVGDFTWTGWDYLGEAGVGRPRYPDSGAFSADYPWLTAGSGDIDITGHRRPISYYREIVFGLRNDPYLAVQRPEHHDNPATVVRWSWTDSVASWTWDVPVGAPVTVEAYADADEVAFVVNETEAARSPVGPDRSFVATAELTYQPGTLEAVAYRGGTEVGRCALATAATPARLELSADREQVADDGQDVAFVELTLVDEAGIVNPISDRVISVEVDGPASLQGLGTARPATEEFFLESSCTTYEGRALAVVRPHGAGEVTVRVRADGLAPATITLTAKSG